MIEAMMSLGISKSRAEIDTSQLPRLSNTTPHHRKEVYWDLCSRSHQNLVSENLCLREWGETLKEQEKAVYTRRVTKELSASPFPVGAEGPLLKLWHFPSIMLLPLLFRQQMGDLCATKGRQASNKQTKCMHASIRQ